MEYKKEFIILILILVLSVALINPFHILMPSMTEMAIVVSLVLIFSLSVGFFWMESGGDERDVVHKMAADRMAYFAGASVLIIGILAQSLRHELSDWLVAALTAMVAAKVVGLIHGRHSH